ncbi:MAG: coniferyl aldehyde dehydrogenase [Pseudomonadota bacterium]|nr:coniferyl aldehyde dehydrogenase [Pseudomonadota bacterium]
MAGDQTRIDAAAEGVAEARRLFQLQHKASRRGGPVSAEMRRDRLGRLRALVAANEAAFTAAISNDFGVRSGTETELLELVPTLNAIRHARKKLANWMRPERRRVAPTFQPARAWVRHEPLGVIGIISPWNYPLQLALSPLVDAISAGNRAMLKPSELTPAFSALLKRLVSEHFDEAEVAVVTGGAEVGAAFSGLRFDHLLFTGSTEVGIKVYQAAAANLTPVTLELGGKSPAVVCPDYALDKAARSIAFGKFINAGQTCIAPDYVLVPATRAEAFAEQVMSEARRAYPRIAGNDDYSAVISGRHFERLDRAIAGARAAGAKVLTHQDEGAREERKIGPTVILNAQEGTIFLSEEIFGPVLPIVPYERIEDAIAFIAARERPLALYCFSDQKAHQQRVLDAVLSGGVTLNGTLLHFAQENLPFGGVGRSGIGAYHGQEGFRRFSHTRAVHKVGFFNAFERIGPPWGKLSSTVGRLMARSARTRSPNAGKKASKR